MCSFDTYMYHLVLKNGIIVFQLPHISIKKKIKLSKLNWNKIKSMFIDLMPKMNCFYFSYIKMLKKKKMIMG